MKSFVPALGAMACRRPRMRLPGPAIAWRLCSIGVSSHLHRQRPMIDHEIYQRSELFVQNLIEVIGRPLFDCSPQLAVSGNLCQMSIEHSCAFRAVSEHRMFASGFVVLRAQFEALVRAIWALYLASDEQIKRLHAPLDPESEQSAKSLPSVNEMLIALADVPAAKVPFDALTEFKDGAWKALNSFTHAGIHPLSRMRAGYPLEFLIQNVKVSNALAMVAGMQYCILTGLPNLQKILLDLNRRFEDCLPPQSVDRASATPLHDR